MGKGARKGGGKEGGYKRREGGMEGGSRREGARGWWGREGESQGREVGSDDARQAESVVEEGRVDEGNEAWTAGGRKREEGLSKEWGGSKGGKLQGRYPEGTHWPVYSIFTNHPTTRPLTLMKNSEQV